MEHKRIFYYSYEHFCLDIEGLKRKLEEFRFRNPVILGIPRGGLIPATVLAHKLDYPLRVRVDTVTVRSNDTTIIVDEILDTGSRMHIELTILTKAGIISRVPVVLVTRELSYPFPYICARFISRNDYDWIHFWWEAPPNTER